MEVTTATVEKITIKSFPYYETISVVFEDFGPSYGKTTITCDDKAWTYRWGGLGDEDMKTFFLTAHYDYLVRKFQAGITPTINDESAEALQKDARENIIDCRKQGELTREEARNLWDEAEWIEDGIQNQINRMEEIFGEAWWEHAFPQKPNPDYEYLARIVKKIQSALKNQESRIKEK